MILGFTHLTLRAPHLKKASEELKLFGYEVEFTDQNMPEVEGKRQFLTGWAPKMGITLCRSKGKFPVELVDYAWAPPRGDSPFELAFFAPPEALTNLKMVERTTETRKAVAHAFGLSEFPTCYWHPYFECTFWCFQVDTMGAKDPGVIGVVQRTPNVSRSLSLWSERLGFQSELFPGTSGRCGKTVLKAAVPSWTFQCAVIEDKTILEDQIRLDGYGVTVLAFLVSDLEADSRVLNPGGANPSSGTFFPTVNSKRFRMEIASGIPGIFVELMELRRT